MQRLVARAVSQFQREYGVRVTREARQALLEPALPHARDVLRDVERGQVSVEELEEHVRTILVNAYEMQPGTIGAELVVASMDRECPYLFWC